LLRSRPRRSLPSLDVAYAVGLDRDDACRGGRTARFDGSGADRRDDGDRARHPCATPFLSTSIATAAKPRSSQATPSSALADVMRAGSRAVACLAVVPDWPVLGRNAEGALAAVRAPESRELYRYHLDRLAGMGELIAEAGRINGAPGHRLQYGRRAPCGIYFRPGRQ
jgi:hypothetical protein